jgi:non-heme chloroperoxidase
MRLCFLHFFPIQHPQQIPTLYTYTPSGRAVRPLRSAILASYELDLTGQVQRARDLDAVLKQLRAGSVVLVGWSQGVQDVAAYVEQFGTKSIAGFVLVDSTVSHGADAIIQSPQFAAQQLGLFALYSADPTSYTRGFIRAIIKRPLPQREFDTLVADALKTPTAIGEAMLISDMFGVDRRPCWQNLTGQLW